jgi:hypothetical protein
MYDVAPPNERGISALELSNRFGPRSSYLQPPVDYDKWLSNSLNALSEDSVKMAHRLVLALINPFQGTAEGIRFPGHRDAQLFHTPVTYVSRPPVGTQTTVFKMAPNASLRLNGVTGVLYYRDATGAVLSVDTFLIGTGSRKYIAGDDYVTGIRASNYGSINEAQGTVSGAVFGGAPPVPVSALTTSNLGNLTSRAEDVVCGMPFRTSLVQIIPGAGNPGQQMARLLETDTDSHLVERVLQYAAPVGPLTPGWGISTGNVVPQPNGVPVFLYDTFASGEALPRVECYSLRVTGAATVRLVGVATDAPDYETVITLTALDEGGLETVKTVRTNVSSILIGETAIFNIPFDLLMNNNRPVAFTGYTITATTTWTGALGLGVNIVDLHFDAGWRTYDDDVPDARIGVMIFETSTNPINFTVGSYVNAIVDGNLAPLIQRGGNAIMNSSSVLEYVDAAIDTTFGTMTGSEWDALASFTQEHLYMAWSLTALGTGLVDAAKRVWGRRKEYAAKLKSYAHLADPVVANLEAMPNPQFQLAGQVLRGGVNAADQANDIIAKSGNLTPIQTLGQLTGAAGSGAVGLGARLAGRASSYEASYPVLSMRPDGGDGEFAGYGVIYVTASPLAGTEYSDFGSVRIDRSIKTVSDELVRVLARIAPFPVSYWTSEGIDMHGESQQAAMVAAVLDPGITITGGVRMIGDRIVVTGVPGMSLKRSGKRALHSAQDYPFFNASI